jgi:hypothetical protein
MGLKGDRTQWLGFGDVDVDPDEDEKVGWVLTTRATAECFCDFRSVITAPNVCGFLNCRVKKQNIQLFYVAFGVNFTRKIQRGGCLLEFATIRFSTARLSATGADTTYQPLLSANHPIRTQKDPVSSEFPNIGRWQHVQVYVLPRVV